MHILFAKQKFGKIFARFLLLVEIGFISWQLLRETCVDWSIWMDTGQDQLARTWLKSGFEFTNTDIEWFDKKNWFIKKVPRLLIAGYVHRALKS